MRIAQIRQAALLVNRYALACERMEDPPLWEIADERGTRSGRFPPDRPGTACGVTRCGTVRRDTAFGQRVTQTLSVADRLRHLRHRRMAPLTADRCRLPGAVDTPRHHPA